MVEIVYSGNEEIYLIIKSYSDSNWARDYIIGKLISGFIFILNGGTAI